MFDLYIEHKTLRRFHLRERAHVVFPRRTYNAKHLRAEHKSGDEPQIVSAAHFEVSDNEQMELMF